MPYLAPNLGQLRPDAGSSNHTSRSATTERQTAVHRVTPILPHSGGRKVQSDSSHLRYSSIELLALRCRGIEIPAYSELRIHNVKCWIGTV